MILITIKILKCLLLANMITTFAPITWVLDLLPENMIKWILQVLFSCSKCATAWITLIYTQNLFIASAAYFAMSMITIAWNNITGMFIRRLNKNN